MELKITPSGQTIVKPTALGPGTNTDTKLLIYGLFQKGRVLAQDGDGTGLCVYAKRLEKGKFACLWSGGDGEPVRLTTTELSLFLEGSRLVGKISLSPPEMTQFSLAVRSSL